MSLKLVLLGAVLAASTASAKPAKQDLEAMYKDLVVPQVVDITDAELKDVNTAWGKASRKLASEMTFSESDLSADFVKFRTAWLKAKTGNEIEALLNQSYANYDKYSPDMKYFLAQLHVLRVGRGIVWRFRPMFEQGGGWMGNKATHVAAVQFVRGISSGMETLFPTAQTDALVEYLTQPSAEMAPKASQFNNVFVFQKFLIETFVPALNESITRTKQVMVQHPTDIFKWDNKIFFGSASFQDGIKRVAGYGTVEMHLSQAAAYSAMHDALVFSAYNQDAMIDVARDMGRLIGIDSVGFKGDGDLGVTDQERVAVVKNAAKKNKFLELRNYGGRSYGSELMAQAYTAKKNSVIHVAEAYNKLKNKSANSAMAVNPVFYQTDTLPRLEGRIENIRSLVMKAGETRDPVTGEVVTLDLPNYYKNPPANLTDLMPTAFDAGPQEYSIKNTTGETMKVRNYKRGRSIAWDNTEWSKYVTSAKSKPKDYMADAKRVMLYSMGVGNPFGSVNMFVR